MEVRGNCSAQGYHSVVKEATKFSRKLGLELTLTHPVLICRTEGGVVVQDFKVKQKLRSTQQEKLKEQVAGQPWHGKLLAFRWEEEKRGGCTSEARHYVSFSWLKQWRTCLTYVLAGVYELYEQLLRTRVYQAKKTRTGPGDRTLYGLCAEAPETVAHILAGCLALVQSKYLQRHNAVLKIIFFEMLHTLDIVDSVPSWYSSVEPKPVYESDWAQAFGDVPVYANNVEVRSNRVDAPDVDNTAKSIKLLEMSCPWLAIKEIKSCEKTEKYASLQLELKRQFAGHQVKINIIMDVLVGYNKEVESNINGLVGPSSRKEMVLRMQKTVLSQSLHIACHVKALAVKQPVQRLHDYFKLGFKKDLKKNVLF